MLELRCCARRKGVEGEVGGKKGGSGRWGRLCALICSAARVH